MLRKPSRQAAITAGLEEAVVGHRQEVQFSFGERGGLASDLVFDLVFDLDQFALRGKRVNELGNRALDVLNARNLSVLLVHYAGQTAGKICAARRRGRRRRRRRRGVHRRGLLGYCIAWRFLPEVTILTTSAMLAIW